MTSTPPKVKITGQYIKDLSFESPLSPGILVSMPKEPPKISIEFDIVSTKLNAEPVPNGDNEYHYYEVIMHVTAKATVEENKTAFVCDVRYASVASVETAKGHLDTDAVKFCLLVDVPSMMFPFAREIIARSTASAGFPPLMLDPVDFESTYNDNMKQKQS